MNLPLPSRNRDDLLRMTIPKIKEELIFHQIPIRGLRLKKDFIQRHLDAQKGDISQHSETKTKTKEIIHIPRSYHGQPKKTITAPVESKIQLPQIYSEEHEGLSTVKIMSPIKSLEEIHNLIQPKSRTYREMKPNEYLIHNSDNNEVFIDDLLPKGKMIYVKALTSVQHNLAQQLTDWKFLDNGLLFGKLSQEDIVARPIMLSVNPSTEEKWILSRSGQVYRLS